MQEEFAVIRLLTDFSRISETRVANRSIPCELLHFLTHLHVYPFQRCFDVFLFAFFLYIYKETLGFIQNVLHNKQLRYNLVLQAACLVIFVSTPPHFFQVSSSQDALWVHGDEHFIYFQYIKTCEQAGIKSILHYHRLLFFLIINNTKFI